MDMDMPKKIERIKELINRLNNDHDVTNSSLSRVLSEEEFNHYKKEWDEELASRKVEKPEVIKIYEKKIKIAILNYTKMERYSLMNGKAVLAREYAHKAESQFERAIEFLEDHFQSNSDLRLWIDRDPDGSSLDPISIPRVIGSKSFECQDKRKSPYPIMTKKQLKLTTLEMVLENLLGKDDNSQNKFLEPTYSKKKKVIDTSGFNF